MPNLMPALCVTPYRHCHGNNRRAVAFVAPGHIANMYLVTCTRKADVVDWTRDVLSLQLCLQLVACSRFSELV